MLRHFPEDLRARLETPIDGASLAVFRIVFGLTALWQVWIFRAGGALGYHWDRGGFHMTYWPLDFLQPLPELPMQVLLAAAGLSALMLAPGFLTRLHAAVFCLLFSYLFLLERGYYLNHYYLICLLAFLLVVLPSGRCWSVDSLLFHQRGRSAGSGSSAGSTGLIPRGALWLLRFQLCVPMFYGGLAKLNPDWLIRGQPLGIWFEYETFGPVIGPLGSGLLSLPLALLISWGGFLLDILFPVYMLCRRTRLAGLALLLLFHLLNDYWFNIGVFPAMMALATLVFLEPDWPRRFLSVVLHPRWDLRFALIPAAAIPTALLRSLYHGWAGLPADLPAILAFGFAAGVLALTAYDCRRGPEPAPLPTGSARPIPGLILLLAALWIFVQLAVPLRHHLIPGPVAWTGEAAEFSWRMMLVSRHARFSLWFRDAQPEYQLPPGVAGPVPGPPWTPVDSERRLTGRQLSWLAVYPHMMVQYAHWLDHESPMGRDRDLDIRAHSMVSINGRAFRRLVDPRVDLTETPRIRWGHGDFILPLEGYPWRRSDWNSLISPWPEE